MSHSPSSFASITTRSSSPRSSWSRLPDPWRSYTPAAGSSAAAPAPAEGRAPGLVLCAISGRTPSDTTNDIDVDLTGAEVPDTAAGLRTPAFASPALVDAAATMLTAVGEEPGALAEGPRRKQPTTHRENLDPRARGRLLHGLLWLTGILMTLGLGCITYLVAIDRPIDAVAAFLTIALSTLATPIAAATGYFFGRRGAVTAS